MPSSPKKQKRKPEPAARQTQPAPKAEPAAMPLGAALLALSYAIMYIEKEVDGLFALDIAPFTLVGAYLWVLYAIFWRGKKKQG